jgi:hypothetical protein
MTFSSRSPRSRCVSSTSPSSFTLPSATLKGGEYGDGVATKLGENESAGDWLVALASSPFALCSD